MLKNYYKINQLRSETCTVAIFANRFLDCQHKLIKLIPGIHITQENDDIELCEAFLIKLRPEIKKELMSRDFQFKNLQEIIDVAICFESHSAPPTPSFMNLEQATSMPIHPKPFAGTKRKPASFKNSQDSFSEKKPHSICQHFNRFLTSNCEQKDNKHSKGRLHKCLTCGKFGCKMIHHEPKPRGSAQLTSSQFEVNTAASITWQNQLLSQLPNSSVNNEILSIVSSMQQKLSELEAKQQPASATASVSESQVPVSSV